MNRARKNYQKMIQELMKRATIRELAGLYTFTKAYLGINEEAHSGSGPTRK